MYAQICFLRVALLALVPVVSLPAQTKADLTAMTDALKLRSEIAGNIASGSEKLDLGLQRLKAQHSSSGLRFASDADFAFAAIDVGRRLLTAGKPAEAERFFRAAEESLNIAAKGKDTTSRDKAQFLCELALIRANYLNETAQAKEDIENALTLQPDDKALQRTKSRLSNERAEHFKDKPTR